jgi:GNAT superfamily N-acetyltransferase
MERKKLLDTQKNPFYYHAELEMFLALKDGQPCGRIAAIVNKNHNIFHNDHAGFWGFFECTNNQSVSRALFDAAANWLRSKGKDTMLGPVNPSTNDEAGMLVEGFDHPPYIMMPHNHSYYPYLVKDYGHKKARDLYAWFVTTEQAKQNISEKMIRVSDKILKKYNIRIRNIKLKNLHSELKLIKEIYNNAWSQNWGFVPFTDEEINAIADDLKPIADEQLLLMAEKEGEPIAFSVALPNINEILAKIPNGRLLPGGIFKLLFERRKITTLRVIILGVKQQYQFMGLGSVFYKETIKRGEQNGYVEGEMSWILEDNHTMNRAIEAFGAKQYKTYRIYQYAL